MGVVIFEVDVPLTPLLTEEVDAFRLPCCADDVTLLVANGHARV
jgi:hypothetical protein